MLTPEAAAFLIKGAPNSKENPFVTLHGVTTLRADQFEITPRWDLAKFNGYFIRYFWRGLLVSVEKLDLTNRDSPITLQNIELRHTVDLAAMGLHIPGKRRNNGS